MPAKPKPTAFHHFWSFIGHICAENRSLPLLDFSGSLLVDGVRYNAVRYSVSRSVLLSGRWMEAFENLWATRRQVHALFEKYYQLRNQACSGPECTGPYPHRLLQSYGKLEETPTLFLLVSVVANYDVLTSEPVLIDQALDRIKPTLKKKK